MKAIKSVTINGLNVKRIEMGGGKLFEAMRDYEELEYIESTGTQWLEIPYADNMSGCEVCAEYYIENIGSKFMAFVFWHTSDGIAQYGYQLGNGSTKDVEWVAFGADGCMRTERISTVRKKVRVVADFASSTISVDGAVRPMVNNNSLTFGKKAGVISVFCRQLGNGTIQGNPSMRMYSLAIKRESQLLDLHACRRVADGAVGMYDTVTRTFFANQGSGSFIAGPATGRYY